QALVQGLVVNKFRGDLAFFQEGIGILEERSARPVLGVIPFVPDLRLPEEDAAALDTSVAPLRPEQGNIDIAVIRLPHIANFDDLPPLASKRGITLRSVPSLATRGQPHAVILPGTKSTIADLLWLREQGLAPAIQHLAQAGTVIVGICGGYQMLGRRIQDPL